jgi:hypothetical protein
MIDIIMKGYIMQRKAGIFQSFQRGVRSSTGLVADFFEDTAKEYKVARKADLIHEKSMLKQEATEAIVASRKQEIIPEIADLQAEFNALFEESVIRDTKEALAL